MTDRYSGFLVTLDEDIRDDDAESTINALKMIKGVLSVKPIIHDDALTLAEERQGVKCQEMLRRLYRQVRDHGPDSVLPEEKS